MTGLGEVLWLVAGLGSLAATGWLVACCLRVRSPLEFLLATYIVAWSGLVTVTLLLSPLDLVTRPGLVTALVACLLASLAAWSASGRPGSPPVRSVLVPLRQAVRAPAVLVLALGVGIVFAYILALAFFTPVNEGDALAYHLARAAFWHQGHGLGYVQASVDLRLDTNPPNAEIGQLATMVLSGSDRYVALPQLVAFGALVLCVAAIARRIGLEAPAAAFGALAFATLPVVAVQAPGALNDLVVASFLACATLFALRPGRARLLLFGLALGLALGTKFTAVLALPALALVVGASRSPRAWPGLAGAGLVGAVFGSVWYLVNLIETGELDGGQGRETEQLASHSPASVLTTALRFGLDAIDMSGTSLRHSLLFLAVAVLLALSSLLPPLAARRRDLLLAAAVTACVPLLFPLGNLGQHAVEGAWAVLGKPETPSFDDAGQMPNIHADTTQSWYGPLGALLLVLGPVGVVVHGRRTMRRSALAMSLAPWVMLLTLAVALIWDPYRGRFLAFGVALAAATWGLWLRRPSIAAAISAIGVVALFLTLNFHLGKPSGLGELWPRGSPYSWREGSAWTDTRPQAQTRLRPGGAEIGVLEFFESHVPAEADVALAPRDNDFLSPYFGPRLTRRVSLLRPGDPVPASAEWLVLSPGAALHDCEGRFEPAHSNDEGWLVARRVASGSCHVARQADR